MSGRRVLFVLGLAVVTGSTAVAAAACSSTSAPRSTCGPIRQEALDPNYLVHVLPGARRLHYSTDPPTSGPHQPSPHLARVQRRPLSRPVQVGLLEAGVVLVQYRDIGANDVAQVRSLAARRVVVAPNPDLPAAARVVATAWISKRSCSSFDAAAIRQFIGQRAGKGPGAPPTGP